MNEPLRYQILRNERARAGVASWWHALQTQRGQRAELRRCDKVEAVLLSAGFRNLWQKLSETGLRRDSDLLAWACVAAVLAEIRSEPENKAISFAGRLGGQKEGSGKPCVSELRFAQLQKSRDADTLLRRLRRSLALIEKKAPLLSLADSVLLWHREQQGRHAERPTDRLAVRWATEYFTALGSYPNK